MIKKLKCKVCFQCRRRKKRTRRKLYGIRNKQRKSVIRLEITDTIAKQSACARAIYPNSRHASVSGKKSVLLVGKD